MAEKTVEQRCYEALKARGVTFAAAESCTGGLIAKRITDVPGASGVFMGGVVSYTNIVKHRVLGVPADMLEEYGAVSAPVARAMAEGARKASDGGLRRQRHGRRWTRPRRAGKSRRHGIHRIFRRPRRRSPSALTSARLPARKFAGKRRMKPSSCSRKS